MSEQDEIRVEVDPALPQGWLKAISPDGKLIGTIRGIRPSQQEGVFCQRRTVNLKVVIFDSLIDYLMLLYEHARRVPDYLFLNEEDYWNLNREVATRNLYRIAPSSEYTKRNRLVKFVHPVTGDYMHLATLPDLQEGEIMVIYDYQ